ncbi:unnamed protein product [Cercospora beticola]|nr:unnamed protein product [Cercospora beticola]
MTKSASTTAKFPNHTGQSLPSLESAMSTPPDYNGDAATKVFAIPELLEHILHCGVTSQYNKALADKKIPQLKMWPMPGCGTKDGICLFTIQRVSKDFQNTIQGSTKLKKLMFLAPQENDELMAEEDWRELELPYFEQRVWLPLHKPLTCILGMFASMGKEDLIKFGFQTRYQSQTEGDSMGVWLMDPIFHEDTALSEIAAKKVPKGWHNPEASWRKIKVCNAKVRQPAKLKIESTCCCCDEHDLVDFEITLELDEDLTLEHIFDCFSELFTVAGDQLKKREEFDNFAGGNDHVLEQYRHKLQELEAESNKEILARLQHIVKG